MANNLACLPTAHCKPKPVSNVVKSGLKLLEQEFAGHAGLIRGLLVVGAKLGLERKVDALRLLLLTKLETVADNLLDLLGLAMLAWREVALLNGAFLGKAFRALEKKLGTVAPAHAADGSCVTCHGIAPGL